MSGTNENGVAVFGCGRIGALHLKNLADLYANVIWVVDVKATHEQIQKLLKEKHLHSTKLVDVADTQAVLDDSRVHGVVISTRVDSHEDLIRKSLKAGKHVFCEKPLALSTESIRACYDLADQLKLTLMCGFQRRFDADFKAVYDQIQSNKLGKVQLIKITSRDNPRHHNDDYIRHSGGIFLDSCVHDFDIAIWLAGEMPSSVVAYGNALTDLFKECDDVSCTTIMIKFPSGTIATIDNSRLGAEYGYDQRIEVLCTKGMIKSENPRLSNVQINDVAGTILSPNTDFFHDRYDEAFREEMKYFLELLKGNVKNVIKAEEVIAGCVLVQKAQESYKQQQNIVIDEIKSIG